MAKRPTRLAAQAVAPQVATPAAPPAEMPPLNVIGPGGGALSAITPLNFSADAGYGANSYLLGMAAPRGQTFSITPFGGDKMDALHSFGIGADNPIRVTDQAGNILYSGTGYEGAQAVADLTRELTGNKDIEKFSVEGFDPYTGQWQGLAGSARPTDQWGEFADLTLPIVGAVLAGPLGAAAGSALSGTVQGRSIGDIAKNAALSGATAYAGGQLIGTGGGLTGGLLGSGAGGAASTAAGTAAGGLSAPGVINVIGQAGGNALSNALASGVGAAVGGVGGSAASGGAQTSQPSSTTPAPALDPSKTIVVPGTSASPTFLEAFAPFMPAAAGTGLAATSLGAATPPSNTITVEADRPTPPGGTLPPAPIPAIAGVLPPAAVTAAEIASATAGAKAPTPPAEGGLLQDIIRYYNLGALGVDTLSGLLGGMQGGAGATSPYASQLGPAPTFGRGAFQPFTGDYETYGFGPEFSFFAPQPANTPSAPVSSMLNPLLPVNNMATA